MDLVLIEILLWAGLIFFFWALKDGLGHVESDIDSFGLQAKARAELRAARGISYVRPERLLEPIGSYQDARIHRYAIVDGRRYQFDRVVPAGSGVQLAADEFCMAPGLVYRACEY